MKRKRKIAYIGKQKLMWVTVNDGGEHIPPRIFNLVEDHDKEVLKTRKIKPELEN